MRASCNSNPRVVRCACAAPSPAPRRNVIIGTACGVAAIGHQLLLANGASASEPFVPMTAIQGKDYGKAPMLYPDYEMTPSGLQYKDLRVGSGPTPRVGDTAVIDWQGYTVGYYGRVFEARNKTKGGSFEGADKAFLRLKLGTDKIVPGVEEALLGIRVGGIRRIIIPEGLGYPNAEYMKWAPSPTTFAGKRTLDFVLNNRGLIDKTLLIDVELMKIT